MFYFFYLAVGLKKKWLNEKRTGCGEKEKQQHKTCEELRLFGYLMTAQEHRRQKRIYRPNWTLEEKVRRRKSLYYVTCNTGRGGISGQERCEKLNVAGYINVLRTIRYRKIVMPERVT
jgi:hypothetical protein